ncbi:hypothetical protein [Nonomuraea sp. NPDC002799]
MLGNLAGKLPELIIDGVRDRRAAREQAAAASVNQVAEERLQATLQAYSRERYERDFLLERYRQQGAHYPLGTVGRIHQGAQNSNPSVLVSPVPAGGRLAGNRIPGLVHEALRGVPAFGSHAKLHTGSFVSDNGIPRSISGSVGAEEIGALEFPGHPAIILYFEHDGDVLSVFALLNSLFPTVDGSLGFSLPVASFGWDPGRAPSRPGSGDLPTWQYINLATTPQPQEKVVAAVIAWFVLVCLDHHWRARGVGDVDLLGQILPETWEQPPPRAAEPPVEDVFAYRLETELGELLHAGYEPEVTPFTDNQVALIVDLQDRQVALIVTAAYPAKPPLVLVQSGAEGERLDLDESAWTPDRTLLEIVESLR